MPEAGEGIRVVAGVEGLARDDERLLFAVGVFDGLHRGHGYLLARLRTAAAARGARPAVITFDAHPDAIILGHAPPLLLDPDERLGRLARAGVAVTVVQHFDEALRRTTYDAFVRAVASRTHLAGFLMTPDAAFGHERRGTPEALAALGGSMGYDVVVVPPYQVDGGPVRSQRIREAIAGGDLAGAARLLGRGMAIVGSPGRTDVDGSVPVETELPFALPPEGRYRVGVERAWTAAGPSATTPRRAVAVVRDGVLTLPGHAIDGLGRRVRVAIRGAGEARPRLPDTEDPATIRRS